MRRVPQRGAGAGLNERGQSLKDLREDIARKLEVEQRA
jgi:hypothetical protein